MTRADDAFALAVIFMIGCSFYYGSRIRADRIAVQWGLDGRPTRYAPKWIGVWGLVLAVLALRLAIWAGVTFAPQSVHDAETGLLAASVVLAAAHLYILSKAARSR